MLIVSHRLYQCRSLINYYFLPLTIPVRRRSGVPQPGPAHLKKVVLTKKDHPSCDNRMDTACLLQNGYSTNIHFFCMAVLRLSDRSWPPVHHKSSFADLRCVSNTLRYKHSLPLND